MPQVDYGGQGGLGDVVLHPDFASNGLVYLSYAEAGEGGTRGAAVGRGRLVAGNGAARLEGFQVIWRQAPKFDGRGHYGHRIAFSPDGRFMFISSGRAAGIHPGAGHGLESPARCFASTRTAACRPTIRSRRAAASPRRSGALGHRNPLGLAFAPDGRLWEVEMGPRGGDELNLIERGGNYGYPRVSNGDHYDGRDIPDHSPGDGFVAPEGRRGRRSSRPAT